MIDNLRSCDEIIVAANELELYPDLVQQLIKDFERTNIQFGIEKDISSIRLKQLLKEKLYVLLLEKYDDLNRLLYTIDIPERYLKEVATQDAVDLSETITFLVLKRQLQKVWYRNNTAL